MVQIYGINGRRFNRSHLCLSFIDLGRLNSLSFLLLSFLRYFVARVARSFTFELFYRIHGMIAYSCPDAINDGDLIVLVHIGVFSRLSIYCLHNSR